MPTKISVPNVLTFVSFTRRSRRMPLCPPQKNLFSREVRAQNHQTSPKSLHNNKIPSKWCFVNGITEIFTKITFKKLNQSMFFMGFTFHYPSRDHSHMHRRSFSNFTAIGRSKRFPGGFCISLPTKDIPNSWIFFPKSWITKVWHPTKS